MGGGVYICSAQTFLAHIGCIQVGGKLDSLIGEKL